MFQQITLVGRIGLIKDIIKTDDYTVQTFTLATEERFTKVVDGERKKFRKTTWWTISVWGGAADAFNEYKKVGDIVLVIGDVDFNEKDGKRYVNVRAQNIRYLPTPDKKEHAESQATVVEEIK